MLLKFIYSCTPFVLQRIAWPLAQPFFTFFLRTKYNGIANVVKLPRNKRIIFASNHISELDPILITGSMPFFSRFLPLFYVSRSKKDYRNGSVLKRLIYGGLFFKLWGAFPTFSGHKNYEKSLTHHLRILRMNLPVLIFPEGGISRGGVKREPRGGVIYLARYTDALIVPVRISGVSDITSKDFFKRKRNCIISFGKAIDVLGDKEPKSSEDYKEAAGKIVDTIHSL
jgi:1-acyl-sn-glycerol-3-phosphate acyltransferase